MARKAVKGGGDCDAEKWAVVDDDGTTDGQCYDDEAAAQEAIDADTATDAAAVTSSEGETPFRTAVMAVDRVTSDGRAFRGQVSLRSFPLSFRTQTVDPAYGGHEGAWVSGRIDRMEERGGVWLAWGHYSASEDGQRAAAMVRDGSLRFVSVDAGECEVGWECVATEVTPDGYGGSYERCVDEMTVYTDPTVMSVTQVAIPAFAGATISLIPPGESPEQATAAEQVLVDVFLADTSEAPVGTPVEPDIFDIWFADRDNLAASAATITPPLVPPAAWFTDPGFDRLTPRVVTDDGRVMGHLAPWRQCHTGFPEVCVTAPPSLSAYQWFHHGELLVGGAEGPTPIKVGQLTVATTHAQEHLSAAATLAHYEDTGCVFADVVVGEDAHGIWFSGAARPGVTAEQLREFRAASPSGDWRRLNGHLELVAALMVNSPGFPVLTAAAGLHDGHAEQRSLITGLRWHDTPKTRAAAAFGVQAQRIVHLEQVVERLQRQVQSLLDAGGRDAIFDALAASVGV